MIEITFKGRGGQGAVIASEMLGRAFFLEGKYPQCFSLFGGERRGAPVTSFLRVDDKPILLKCQIQRPNQMILFDLSLIELEAIVREMTPEAIVLINTHSAMETFSSLKGFRVGLIDAGSIARAAGLEGTFNTAMLGAYARVSEAIRLETLIDSVRAMVPARVEANIEALKEAYHQTKIYGTE
jgi:2-oxoacid:acceptor oxidoreductase gamma subunit (pyruvate/2-ketoisovalerate family)